MAQKSLTKYEVLSTKYGLFSDAKKYIAGGVNSPIRSFKAVGGDPLFIKRGRGSKIYDESGREFIDYCLSWGALILGHSHPDVVEALKEALGRGTSFGAPTLQETELAKLIQEALPSIDSARLTNSGTEAVMGAVRAARGFTKKNKIIRFADSYHGSADCFLGTSAGVPEDFKKHTLSVPYNDSAAVSGIAKKDRDVAAIIVEPVEGNAGVVLPKEGFLKKLREISDKYGIVLIFDEVITGFRVSYGGAQGLFGVKTDLTCLGKIIGGGLPMGAFGGRRDIMKHLAPEGSVYQAGTFSGNPISVRAGITALKILKETDPYKTLEEKTKTLCDGIIKVARRRDVDLRINRIASLFDISFKDTGLFKIFFHSLLGSGVYLSPSPLESNFMSTAHTDEDIAKTIKAAEKALGR